MAGCAAGRHGSALDDQSEPPVALYAVRAAACLGSGLATLRHLAMAESHQL